MAMPEVGVGVLLRVGMWLIHGRDVEAVPQVDAAQELVVVDLVAVVLAMEAVAEPEVAVVGDAVGGVEAGVEAGVEELKFFIPIYFIGV